MTDTDEDNDGRYPDGSAVLTPFPLTKEQEQGNRAAWPWLTATIAAQVGPDEWQLCIEDEQAATPDGDELLYPLVFRESSEIRPCP